MNCFLCLQEGDVFFNIYDELEQDNYKFTVSEAIAKYFSFKPTSSEASLCQKCWNIITPFHVFCLQIEDTFKQVMALKKKLHPESVADKNKTVNFAYKEGNNKKSDEIDHEFDSNEITIKIEDTGFSDEEGDHRTYASIIPKQEIDIEDTQLVDIQNDSLESGRNSRNNLSILKQEDYADQNDYFDPKPNPYNLMQYGNRMLSGAKRMGKFQSKNKIRDKKRKERTDWYINRKISKFMSLSCDMCEEEISNFKDLQKHFEYKHNQPGYVVCCGVKFYKRYMFVHHIDSHLTSSSSSQNGTKKKKLRCDQCDKKFSREWTLKQHQAYHTPKSTWKFKCEDCRKTLPTHCHLNSHIYFAHKDLLIRCHICFESIKAAYLNKHLKNHPKYDEEKSESEQGPSEYNTQSDYEQTEEYHQSDFDDYSQMNMDEEIRHFACPTCSELFNSEEELNNHIDKDHSITYPCKQCQQIFDSITSYRQHVCVHEANPYTCNICNLSFKTYYILKAHKWQEHSDGSIEFVHKILENP